MRNKIIIIMLCFFPVMVHAQQPVIKPIQIVDTLTNQEKANRNPLLLRAELDSLVKLYAPVQVQQEIKGPMQVEKNNNSAYLIAGIVLLLLMMGAILYLLYRYQQKMTRAMEGIKAKDKNKGRVTVQSLEARVEELDAEMHKLSKENEGLNRVVKEYNGIQHEYDSLKHGIQKAYKIRNYPGYDKSKDEAIALQGVLITEHSVAGYAYEKFLKPILAITDANKNNPAKMSETDRIKILDLLVSLSLLYIEYLYLRVSDLSIGGTMVQRIQNLSKGNGPDPALLKKLNLESGSRALVISMALNRASLRDLSYPVFDETNLNNH